MLNVYNLNKFQGVILNLNTVIIFLLIVIVWTLINLPSKFTNEKETNFAKSIIGLGISMIGCTIPGISDTVIEIVAKVLDIEMHGISNIYGGYLD